jgi:hypothetical protein
MITIKELTEADPRDLTNRLTVTISCLVKTARFALIYADENPKAQVAGSVETTLQVVGELLDVLNDATFTIEREDKRGMWKEGSSDVRTN